MRGNGEGIFLLESIHLLGLLGFSPLNLEVPLEHP